VIRPADSIPHNGLAFALNVFLDLPFGGQLLRELFMLGSVGRIVKCERQFRISRQCETLVEF